MAAPRLWWWLAGIAAAAVLVAAGLPALVGPYYVHVVDVTLVNAVLAIGLNLVLGFGGQISLAQAAFFGIGAYAFAIMQAAGLPVAAAAPLAVLGTAAVGALLGWPTLRLRGHYLALATLAFGLISSELMVNLDGVTGGANGLMGIPGIGLAGNDTAMLPVLLAVVAVGLAASVVFAQGPAGLRVRAFRDDPVAAQAAGVNVRALKIGLFVASAAYAGAAGVCYCCLLGYVSPDVFAWQTTFSYLAMVVVGGLGNVLGPLLGAALYTLVPEWLRFLQEAYFVIFGMVVIAVIALVPSGMAGLIGRAGLGIMGAAPAAAAATDFQRGAGAVTEVLRTERLTRRFGGLVALHGIDLAVRQGTIHAVIGPNGSGKTTLFNVIGGVYPPSEGRVTFLGRDISGLSSDRLARAGLGRTFQNARLFASMTVLETVLVALVRGAALTIRAADRRHALEILDFVGLRDVAHAACAGLPQGQRRLLEIAKVLALDPKLVLLDEPHGGLNHAETARLIEVIRDMRAKGLTILLIEHEMDVVMQLADEITVLNFGDRLAHGIPSVIQADPAVVEAYLGRPAATAAPPPTPTEAPPLLTVRGLTVRFGDVEAVRGIDLEVRAGEIVALLGNNGAGKSTTLKAIARLLPATGAIALDGHDLLRRRTEDLVGLGVALVPERRRLFGGMTVLDNLRTGAYGRSREHADRALAEVLALFPSLERHARSLAFSLSGGEQQMLAIGRALMSRPRLLMLDEPSLGLAPMLVDQVFTKLSEINAPGTGLGTAILLVEQNARMALAIAHRGTVLASGRVVAEGPSATLAHDDRVRHAYLGKAA